MVIEQGDHYLEFVYTHFFERTRQKLLGDDDLRAVEAMLTQRPRRGVVERGTGGVRKVRYALGGGGKSGGARIIYYFSEEQERIYMLLAYPKSKQATMTNEERERIRALVQRLDA